MPVALLSFEVFWCQRWFNSHCSWTWYVRNPLDDVHLTMNFNLRSQSIWGKVFKLGTQTLLDWSDWTISFLIFIHLFIRCLPFHLILHTVVWTDGCEWAYLNFYQPLSLSHTQCRSRKYWQGHRRHSLFTFLPLQQPALSVFRTWGRSKPWGWRAEADREPVSIRAFLHDAAHLAHCWHITLVHFTCPKVTNKSTISHLLVSWDGLTMSVSVFQWSWSGASTLNSVRVWWRVAIGQQWHHTQATGAHMT